MKEKPKSHPDDIYERAFNWAILLFAWWTVCCNFTILLEMSFRRLLAGFCVSAVAMAILIAKFRLDCNLRLDRSRDIQELAASKPPALKPSQRLIAALLVVFAVALALASKDPHIVWWSVVLPLLAWGIYLFASEEPPALQPPVLRRDHRVIVALLIVATVLTGLSANRSDRDDSLYVNIAVAAVERPDAVPIVRDTMLGVEGLPVHLAAYLVHSLELVGAAISLATGIAPIASFHFVLTSIGAILLVLATVQLTRLLFPHRWFTAATVFLVVLLGAGEIHRWYGNFGLVRMWQGKGWMLFVFLPAAACAALRLAERPAPRYWLRLTAALIAAIGCSASALWLGPVTALIAATAMLRPNLRDILSRLGLVVSASLYVLVAGLLVRGRTTKTVITVDLPAMNEDLYLSSFVEVLGDGRLLLFAVLCTAVAGLLAPSRVARRYAVISALAPLLILLNPYLADWVRRAVIGPSFWRALWAIPVPLLITCVVLAPTQMRRKAFGLTLAAGLAASYLWLIPSFHGLSGDNRVNWIWPPQLKVHWLEYPWARRISEVVPGRQFVVAPQRISAWMTTLEDHPFPLSPRLPYLMAQRDRLPLGSAQERQVMTVFVDGWVHLESLDRHGNVPPTLDEAAEIFEQGLAKYGVAAVCLRRRTKTAPLAQRILSRRYRLVDRDRHMELWLHRDLEPPDTIERMPFFEHGFESGTLDDWTSSVKGRALESADSRQ